MKFQIHALAVLLVLSACTHSSSPHSAPSVKSSSGGNSSPAVAVESDKIVIGDSELSPVEMVPPELNVNHQIDGVRLLGNKTEIEIDSESFESLRIKAVQIAIVVGNNNGAGVSFNDDKIYDVTWHRAGNKLIIISDLKNTNGYNSVAYFCNQNAPYLSVQIEYGDHLVAPPRDSGDKRKQVLDLPRRIVIPINCTDGNFPVAW